MNDIILPEEGKASKLVAKSVAKGKKVSQQQAFGAMMEMRQMVEACLNNVGRLAQSQTQFEGILQRLDTNLGVLMSMLIDKEVFSKEDWEQAWDQYVIQPQEDALTKHLEEMKKNSAEDAFFSEVITMVRGHTFEDREVQGQQFEGKQVKEFYMQMLLNPATRRQALVDVRKDIPEIPELNLEEMEQKDEAEAQETERQMPDCKYCGTCEFCQSLEEKREEAFGEALRENPDALETEVIEVTEEPDVV
jgi:hypothetical protein